MTTGGGGWQWKLAGLVAVGTLTLFAWTGREHYAPLDVGSRAPAYAAVNLDGDTVRVRDLRGNVVLVNVWASWCPPCIREMPDLQRLYDQLEPQGLRILAVNVDNTLFGADPAAIARSFVTDFDLTFAVLLDPENRIGSTFQVAGLPTTFVIDRRGRIRQKLVGAREWLSPGMQAEIRALLED